MQRARGVTLLSLRSAMLFLLLPCCAFAAEHKSHQAIDPDDAYKNNCTRCHIALPQSSPRMTKTIMMHMRVVANLPADEAQAILEYLKPSPTEPKKPIHKQNDFEAGPSADRLTNRPADRPAVK